MIKEKELYLSGYQKIIDIDFFMYSKLQFKISFV